MQEVILRSAFCLPRWISQIAMDRHATNATYSNKLRPAPLPCLGHFQPELFVGLGHRHAPLRRALQIPLHD